MIMSKAFWCWNGRVIEHILDKQPSLLERRGIRFEHRRHRHSHERAIVFDSEHSELLEELAAASSC